MLHSINYRHNTKTVLMNIIGVVDLLDFILALNIKTCFHFVTYNSYVISWLPLEGHLNLPLQLFPVLITGEAIIIIFKY